MPLYVYCAAASSIKQNKTTPQQKNDYIIYFIYSYL